MSVVAITPDRGFNHRSTAVEITGTQFLPQVTLGFRSGAGVESDRTFKALLGDHELEDVQLLGPQSLSALVPPALPEGVYDLTVIGPSGMEDSAGAVPRGLAALPLRTMGTISPVQESLRSQARRVAAP
jgi:hypothetical protein